ncbi:bifunctional methylenetetrahydrofolate dehydrogenase/methenyltetrahydrofolate cyclohydrolase [Parenemella sanctibonifatiensis]|uniref:Methylenetetrahydrofolate dehydrogenase n=1 Tax=Parenemella sanctibonifatiensis TaxID=2016505 RepID=A0A255EDH8_9ACTN|nr:bifunctional methylenetetrahydrofolate dehydrogenase/methenyltetrahydrofolate cyclohydrolase [Parenemella sanctibonifatiensis]OYN89606.1 methylenetetrahydrofolate dehydrogenase [Parenemella sanctibonifatiensis]
MSAAVLNPSTVAANYRAEVRQEVARLTEGRAPLRIVGLLSQTSGPAATYARYAAKGAADVGIEMEVRQVDPGRAQQAIAEANADDSVDGIFLYYPIQGGPQDRWLRELVDPRKDVEGLHSFWSRLLYENTRTLDEAGQQRAILPCTPLAILKLLQHAGMRGEGERAPLEGVTACVINRSDIVGRPLSAMLANDGARVHSIDLNGSLVFEPAIGRRAHDVRDSQVTRAEALSAADVVITGVPSPTFELVRGEELKPGAICVNVSEFENFDDSIAEVASVIVPRVGPLTVAMAMRNLVRLTTLR